MRMLLIATFALLSTRASTSHADPIWRTMAAGCIPVDQSIYNNRYLVTAGTVKHQSTNADTITLECPIQFTELDTTADHLRVTYQDNDNTNTGVTTGVQVDLVAVSTADNTFLGDLQLFNSNSFPPTTGATQQIVGGLSGSLDFINAYYYLEVTLTRHNASTSCVNISGTATSCVAVFYGAILSHG